MTQQLYLLRHAEAESWNPLGNDFSRPLNPFGAQHARLVSAWAFEALASPDTVLCSPAKRTRETLAPFLAHWTRLLETTDYVDSIYGASLTMLLTLVEDAFSYSERLLIIGHNPGIMNLLAGVLQPEQATGIQSMSTGTLAVIEFADGFKRHAHTGNLLHLIRKEDLSFN
ncbi:MAG TPA: histidine phosphatase family protein [Xanthomonadales bacterium]